MSSGPWDVRLRRVTWQPVPSGLSVRRGCASWSSWGCPFAVWYFGWLLNPDRVGTSYLYGILIAAELFNLTQALGFWWTVRQRARAREASTHPARGRRRLHPGLQGAAGDRRPDGRRRRRPAGRGGPGLGARRRQRRRRCATSPPVTAWATSGATKHTGAKAGNINHALPLTSAPFIAVFDSDHVADPGFLEATLGHMEDPSIAFVQTPQYYANTDDNRIAAASWAQQALFFGAIARGKDGLDAVFCCGTNVLFRRAAFESVGGFPENSLTEDFELSIVLHEKGWRSAYVPDVLARGLGPEDTASYVSQQQRWARGCLSGIPRALRARLPWRLKAQYLLSGLYFLSGWTVLIYMSFPVVRLLGGGQPLGGIDAPEFLLHFVPYYAVALTIAALAGAGSYTFAAFALSAANFWIHILATIYTVLRKSGSFVVTPKKGAAARQPAAVMPALVAVGVLVAACIYGLDPQSGCRHDQQRLASPPSTSRSS